jgi:hypothetical protein
VNYLSFLKFIKLTSLIYLNRLIDFVMSANVGISSSSSSGIPTIQQLRTEFTLIIKTLNVLQILQHPDDPSLIVKMFDSLKNTINKYPPLSLSAFWSAKSQDDSSLVFKPNCIDEHGDQNHTHNAHDPLNIGSFLLLSAYSCLHIRS